MPLRKARRVEKTFQKVGRKGEHYIGLLSRYIYVSESKESFALGELTSVGSPRPRLRLRSLGLGT
jgi:hypothetical protein